MTAPSTTNAIVALCRFFPIWIPASKYRDSAESSFLLNAITLTLASVVFFIPNKFGLAEGRANAALLLSGTSVARSNLSKITFNLIEPFRGDQWWRGPRMSSDNVVV